MSALNAMWRFLPLVILAAVWEALPRLGLLAEEALPPLSDIAVSFAHLFGEDLGYHTMRSVLRGMAGFLAAVLVGVLAGVLMAWYRPIRILVNPILRCFYPMPKAALIPLTIMWIGLGDASKISLIFIGCLLPIVMSAFNAARGVDDVLVWSARGLGAKDHQVLWEVVLPSALPEILSGIRISLALSFILLIAGELIISNDGVGYLIDVLGEGGDYAGMFAAVITISVIGFAADRGFVALSARLLRWRD